MAKNLMLLFSIIITICSLEAKDIVVITEGDNPQYKISVTHGGEPLGDIKIELFPEIAPKHVHNFDSLVSIQFYDGTAFHRVIPGFMIQGGDPNTKDKPKSTWGFGDPSQTKVPAEFSDTPHLRKTLSAARSQDPNSATSQFFICVAASPWLDGKYSVYGQVIENMKVVDAIVAVPRDTVNNPLNCPFDKVEMTITKIDPSLVNEIITGQSNELYIFPNPSKGLINLRFDDENAQMVKSEIRSIDGRVCYSENHPSGKTVNGTVIPVSELSQGIYILSVTDISGKIHSLKFVIN